MKLIKWFPFALTALCFFVSAPQASAQRLYVLAFYDPSDPDQSQAFANDVKRIESVVRKNCMFPAFYNDIVNIELSYFGADAPVVDEVSLNAEWTYSGATPSSVNDKNLEPTSQDSSATPISVKGKYLESTSQGSGASPSSVPSSISDENAGTYGSSAFTGAVPAEAAPPMPEISYENEPKWTGESLYLETKDVPFFDRKRVLREASKYRNSDHNVLQKAIDALKRCPAGPEDALLVYWAGHGVMIDGQHYLSQKNRGACCARSELLKAAKGVGARLTVLFTDCCAERGRTDFSTDLFREVAVAPAAPVIPVFYRLYSPLFEELFLHCRGVLDVNAVVDGQVAYTYFAADSFDESLPFVDPSKDDSGNTFDISGGCFSLALSSYFVRIGSVYNKLPVATQKAIFSSIRRYDPSARTISKDFLSGIGAFDLYSEDRMTWDAFLNRVQETTNFIYHNHSEYSNLKSDQPNMDIWIKEKPIRCEIDELVDQLKWSPVKDIKTIVGDRVIGINGRFVNGDADFRTLIKQSPDIIRLDVYDTQHDSYYALKTSFRGASAQNRLLGIYPKDDGRGGVLIQKLRPGTPIVRSMVAFPPKLPIPAEKVE